MPDLSDKFYAPAAGWLKTRLGKHFSRFAGVAVVSLVVTQVVLAIAYQIVGTGGTATAIGWAAGVGISYLLSRRAWGRSGRPKLLRETLPFGLISIGTLAVLATTGHFASVYAKSHAFGPLEAAIIVNGCVLAANALTFMARFLIFHYILFADRAAAAGPVAAESIPDPIPVTVPTGPSDQDPAREL